MMDNFREEIVVRKQGKFLNNLGYVFSWFFLIVFGFIGLMGIGGIMNMQFTLANFATFLVGGGIALGMWFYKDNFRTEYEYCFTNGEMDYAMVLGNKRRKPLLSLRMREVEAGGWVDGSTFARYNDMSDVKRLNYYLNGKSRLYYLYYIREGKKTLLLMEPTETMVDMMVKYSKVLEK